MLMQCNGWCEESFKGRTDPRAMAAGGADRRGSSDNENREKSEEEAPQPSVDLRGLLVDLTGCDGAALGWEPRNVDERIHHIL